MNKTIYLVRHGQTRFNLEGRLQGQADSELTPEGLRQTEKLKEMLKEKGLRFNQAYTSDLGRAVETLKRITDDSVKKYTVPGLREVSFGDLDGQLKTQFPSDQDWEEVYADYHAESFDGAVDRMIEALVSLAINDPDDQILAVSHSGVIAGMLEKMGLELTGPIPNGSVWVLELNDQGLRLKDYFCI
ncbi:histidine phosphatase family protein [Ileibacterium valens]|uniref:Histidine phosphatase family protein n=1 Tax=Ileibacterium valens TaxID=1862668 RepID=A0A1U7NGN1_9FIRM|nr:histidine phosphatase family protein [Ileibacterium valens]OLU39103.1 hypothetical protein BM735_08065 [Erysipelotrichaceae bacterium NYU-BL-F16]OLU40210.1 hypothetical protein BO224_06010 [Erysipelotrichaceae bacterium NYU-BL-E8]OLU40409.1 hypothetical protein BO222_05125 [Ileibacterium valens]